MADGFESDLSGPEDLARRALTWFVRGGTWQGLARELAWAAVQASGANYATIEWLTPLLEARLAETVDGLEFTVDMAAVRARGNHVRRRPHDRAVRRLSRLYVDELEWAVGLIEERLERGRPRGRHSPLRVRRRRPPADVEIPRAVAAGL
jgi:hypothetical protein